MVLLLLSLGLAHAQVPVAAPVPGEPVTTGERQGGPFGLGLGLGAPTGLVGKLWLSDWSAVQGGVGSDLGRFGDLVATADYLVLFRPVDTGSEDYSLPVHVGGGFNVGLNTFEVPGQVLLGPRAVFGFSLLVSDMPVEIAVDVAPTFYVYESLTWSVDGQIAARYYY